LLAIPQSLRCLRLRAACGWWRLLDISFPLGNYKVSAPLQPRMICRSRDLPVILPLLSQVTARSNSGLANFYNHPCTHAL
jgi:hypothetical protein